MALVLKTSKVFDRLALHYHYRLFILQGGTSSSKSYSILQFLLYLAMNCPGPLLISIVSETLPHLRKGVERDFYRILGAAYNERYHNKTERIYKIGDNIIEFFSADQSSRVRGPRRDILFINECNNLSKETFDQLEIRTRLKVFLDYNPTAEFWAHELVGKEGVYFDISTYKDNQFLDPNIVKAIESRRYNADGTETDWWRVYGEGQIGVNQGTILSHWTQCHVEDVPTSDHVTYGLDFGFTNDPTVLVRTVFTQHGVYVHQLIHETGLTNDDIDIRMNSLGINPRVSPIYADSAEPKSIEELRRKGWAIRGAVKGKDSIRIGIDFLKSHKLFVTEDSLELIKDLRNYVWHKDSNGNPTNVPGDMWADGPDSLRYSLSYKIQSHNVITKKMIH